MVTFDLRETIIPFSMLQICNHFKQMKTGEVIEIISFEAGIEKDLKSILPESACETTFRPLSTAERKEYSIYLRKITKC
jgi:TusA-related sulfurtransferase